MGHIDELKDLLSENVDGRFLLKALCEKFECDCTEIEFTDEHGYDLEVINIDGTEYLIGDDEKADEAARQYIDDSVWAFNADFISGHTKGVLPDIIKAVQEKMCESCNDSLKAMIEDFDAFVSEAISADGRGHFIGQYDGEEIEVEANGTYYYLYRV